MRRGNVEGHRGGGLDLAEVVELGAAVGCDAAHAALLSADQLDAAPAGLGGRVAFELAELVHGRSFRG
jgi:hypothetical protein